MSRYGDRFKDDLYDTLDRIYQESGLKTWVFMSVLLAILSDLLATDEWSED